MNNLRKPISPVLSAVILAATIIAVGVIVLMWISGHSSMVIRQSQIDLVRSEHAAKENLVIVHASYSGGNITIYVINTGYTKVFLGPIRVPELRTNTDYADIFTPEAIWFREYVVYKNNSNADKDKALVISMPLGALPEYLENLEIRSPEDISPNEDIRNQMKAYRVDPYTESNCFYKIVIPNVLLEAGKTYSIEIWTLIPIYSKLYMCKLYTTQLVT